MGGRKGCRNDIIRKKCWRGGGGLGILPAARFSPKSALPSRLRRRCRIQAEHASQKSSSLIQLTSSPSFKALRLDNDAFLPTVSFRPKDGDVTAGTKAEAYWQRTRGMRSFMVSNTQRDSFSFWLTRSGSLHPHLSKFTQNFKIYTNLHKF